MRPIGFALLLATAAACGPSRGDLTVRWTFDNGSSKALTCDQAGVAYVQVDIGGQVLSPNQFDCVSGGTVTGGAYLGRYLVGTYTVTITGFDTGGFILYQNTFDIRVDGRSTDVTVDLGQPTLGGVLFAYTFNGRSCAGAGVTTVQVHVDGVPLTDSNGNPNFSCTDPRTNTDTFGVDSLALGEHTFEIFGFPAQPPWDSRPFPVDIKYNQNPTVQVDLQ